MARTKRLATMNTQKHSTIESLQDDINELQYDSNTCRSGGRAYSNGHTLSVAQEKQVIQALKRGWYIFFCSTHGFGVNRGHTSATCYQRRDGHVETATYAKPDRTSTALKKGWDKGLWRCGTVVENKATKDLSINSTVLSTPTTPSPTLPPLPTYSTASIIGDTVASGFYLAKGSPCSSINPQAPKILVGTSTGQPQAFSDSCQLNMDPPVTDAHIMPGFQNV